MKRLPSEILTAIGAEVRKRRVAAGYSLEQLGQYAALHRSFLADVEQGRVDPSLSALWSIAGALRCDVGDLLPGGDEGLPAEVRRAVRALSVVDPAVRGAIVVMMGDKPATQRGHE